MTNEGFHMSNPPVRVSLRAPLPEDVEARVALGISAEINRMYGYLEDGCIYDDP